MEWQRARVKVTGSVNLNVKLIRYQEVPQIHITVGNILGMQELHSQTDIGEYV
jgi:hypothetical protein